MTSDLEYEFRKTEHKIYEYNDVIKLTQDEYDKLNDAYRQASENTREINPDYTDLDNMGGEITVDGKLSKPLLFPSDIEYLVLWGKRSLSKKFKIEKI